MLKKKKVRKLIVVVIVMLCFLLTLNIILESILKNHITKELDLVSAQQAYVLGIKDVDVNIFRGNVSISGFYAKPTEVHFSAFAKGETKEDVLLQLLVSKASISGLALFDLIISKELMIDKIDVNEIQFNFYRPEKEYQLHSEEKELPISVNSIHIPWIEKIHLTEMQIADYGLHVIDASSSDTIASFKGKELLSRGLDIDAIEENKGYFTFNNSELELQLKQQNFSLNDALYAISFDDLHYKYDEQEMTMTNFELKPILSPEAFSSKFTDTYSVNTAVIDTLLITGIDADLMFQSGIISLQQIDIKGMAANLFLDKSKPYATDKVLPFPQMVLEDIEQLLYINKIAIHNSSFYYSEKSADKDNLTKVHLDNIQGEVTYITNIPGNLSNKKIDVKLNANLLGALPVSMHLTLPYKTPDNSFFMSGYTKGTTDFKLLNPTIFQAIGVKFEAGRLNGLNFNLRGNSTKSVGELTLLYTDLEMEIYLSDDNENKGLSWVSNSLIKKSNPSKNGRTVVANIDFERVKYKFFGDFLWKSVQSGIVNSLVPFGSRKKKEKTSKTD